MIDFEKIGAEMFDLIGAVCEQYANELNTTAKMTVPFPNSKTPIKEIIPNMCVAMAVLRVNFEASCKEAGMPDDAAVVLMKIIDALVVPRMILMPVIKAD